MEQDSVNNIVAMLSQIEEDDSVPKNIRSKIKLTRTRLMDNAIETEIKCDRSIQELDDIAKDPAMPGYVRPQIWNILSILESNRL